MYQKQNQFGDFSKLLKKLQLENVSVPELRMLKQQHSYLEKLRQQRLKLKTKYDDSECRSNNLKEHNRTLQKIIDEQQNKLSLLQQRYQQSQRKRLHIETTLMRQIEGEKERGRMKIGELVGDIEQLKKQIKLKSISMYQLEDETERRVCQIKEQWQAQRRKLVSEYEQKVKSVSNQDITREQQNTQLRTLVTRQHKALQMQGQQYEQLQYQHECMINEVEQLKQRYVQSQHEREQLYEKVTHLTQINEKLQQELRNRENSLQTKDQLQQIRKKMAELTKGQIEKIQFIVNQFD